MGIIRNLKDGAKEKGKKEAKKLAKKVALKGLAVLSPIIPYILIAVFATSFVLGIIDLAVELFTAENNPQLIYDTFEIEDVAELVVIKENGSGGYYLDFVDDIDKKLEEIINKMNKNGEYHNVPDDVNFLKKMLKAEVVTQFPDLGGEIPSSSTDGFQGAVQIRRVTPNKDPGVMENVGKGETSNLEQGEVNEPVEIEDRNDRNKLESWTSGQKLKILPVDTPIYEDLYGADYWTPMLQEGSTTKEIKLYKGNIVTYQGEYEIYNNALTGDQTIYVKITTEDGIEGYLKISTVEAVGDNETSSLTDTNESIKLATTSRVGETRDTQEKTIGVEGDTYVVAIAAGRNNNNDTGIVSEDGSLVEEELTIQVAERVEELLSGYSNIKVVQTGSTSDNPDGVEPEDRTQLARNANPDLCIQIYFGDGDESGVETIYKEGDLISQQLAEILAENLASSMGLTNLQAGEDTAKCVDSEGNAASLNIIESAGTTGFPSVVAMGGNLNIEPDAGIIAGDGVNKYAQAIVDSIDEYFKADHSGLTATDTGEVTYTTSVESRIINMHYVPEETLQGYIDSGDFENAIKSYTLDENRNVVVATWSVGQGGGLELKTNNSMSLKTALEKYTMPYEYLMYFYIDTDYEDFVEDLADEVMNSEIVVAVQDNVTTTSTTITTEQRTVADNKDFSDYSTDWSAVTSSGSTTETVSTRVNLTYVSTWCVKAYQENSYSEAVLELGNEEEKIVEVPGKVTETGPSSSYSGEEEFDSGTAPSREVDDNGFPIRYSYTVYRREKTVTHTISNTYEAGEYKTEGRENVFVKLYNDHDMIAKVRTSDYLFSIIENNERTANLLNLTKYLIFKATNVPYGVLKFDYEGEYALEQFNAVTTGSWSVHWNNGCTREQFIAAAEAYQPPDVTAFGRSVVECYNKYFRDNAGNYYDICTADGIDPRFVFCIGIHESYYGTSNIANTKGNFWGWGAFDSSPMDSAWGFADVSEGIRQVSAGLKSWTNPGSWQYDKMVNAGLDPTLIDSLYAVPYATDPNWANAIKNYMTEIFGYTAGGGEVAAATGDGYFQTYTSSIGRTYKEYKQWSGSYASMTFEYYAPQTIKQSGCSITSVATVTSGYNNNQTPATLASRTPVLATLLTEGGAQCSGYEAADATRLTSGQPAVVSISGTLVTERGSKYYGGHYIAILDGRNGNEVYVSDVGANDSKSGGWTNVQNIINIVNRGVLYVTN